jgi:hypothetical protein
VCQSVSARRFCLYDLRPLARRVLRAVSEVEMTPLEYHHMTAAMVDQKNHWDAILVAVAIEEGWRLPDPRNVVKVVVKSRPSLKG